MLNTSFETKPGDRSSKRRFGVLLWILPIFGVLSFAILKFFPVESISDTKPVVAVQTNNVPPGKEIVLIDLPPMEGSLGLLRPGDVVDIVTRSKNTEGKTMNIALIEGIQVHSVDAENVRWRVGVLLTKKESETVDSAKSDDGLTLRLNELALDEANK
jgi:hypothetical protein